MADAGANGADAGSGVDREELRRRSEAADLFYRESGWGRLVRKCKEEPVVPIGMLVTVAVLGRGLVAMYSGNTLLSQRMMRYRVLAQGTTLLAITGGLLYQAQRPSDPARGRLGTVDKRWFLDNASEIAVEGRPVGQPAAAARP